MNLAIVLFSGNGNRFCSKIDKSLIKIKNSYLFTYPINTLLNNKNIEKIIVTVNNSNQKFINTFYKKQIATKKIEIIKGSNKSRQHSINKAIKYLKNILKKNDIIITLDGDRPFINNEIINKSIGVSKKHNAAITVIKNYDSILKINNECKYINRDEIYLVQTPQSFKYKIWKETNKSNTDFFSSIKYKITNKNLIFGSRKNFKITTVDDLQLLKI